MKSDDDKIEINLNAIVEMPVALDEAEVAAYIVGLNIANEYRFHKGMKLLNDKAGKVTENN